MYIEESVYQNRPVLSLKRKDSDRYPFTFGLSKAKMILDSIKEIEEFVKKNENAIPQSE